MADAFIGLQMLVTVRGAKLKGTVSSVEAGTSLTLSNVWRLDTNKWEPRITIQAADIIDLTEIPTAPPAEPPAPAQVPNPLPVVPPPSAPAFVDPAIVAVGKKPAAPTKPIEPRPQPAHGEKRDPQPPTGPRSATRTVSEDASPIATVSASMEGLNIKVTKPAVGVQSGDEEIIELEISGQPTQEPRKRTRRGNRRSRNTAQDDPEASPQPGKARAAGQGKGWRQTPMLQSTPSFQPFNSLKRNGAKGKTANDNGWASEDVTDVQEAGDFDFEGQLAKFDKRNLFEQMRKDDQVDDAERLVSHNRQQRPQPGTAGGKNLHHTENVLDVPASASKSVKEKPSKETPNDFWNSEADEGILNGAERLSGREMGSRQSSRRGESKMSTSRRSQSRKASAVPSGQGPTRVNSGVSTQPFTIKLSRPSSRLSITVIDKKKQLAVNASQQGLYLLPSNRKLETVSALQMLNLENIAHNELGLTEDMMTENAGRGIAEVTLTALDDPAIKVRHAATADPSSGVTPPPTVVILAGNNKSGIRAVAAGRHLRNKGVNVLVCVVGIERNERELLEDMRQQVRLFRNFGGQLFSKRDLFNHLRKASIPTLTIDTPRTALSSLANPSPVTLIIDALLGLAISFEELRTGDQTTVYELIEWANRNEAFVLAIDVPTGIDPSSGKVSVIDGNQLYVKPRYVVAMGAPKRGLLEAVVAGEHDDNETISGNAALTDDAATDWRLFVADIGLGAAVWKRAGTKIRRGIDFDDKWVLEMKYRGAPDQGDDMLV
ncbi:YjeF N-terminal domain-like protein [Coniochaeta ligniaria NRRL 30616]|uniref:Enhancer of mRNA-decapping protein 3 n=1 Tax=Coniochaeta ligniaria NRRL 30616 TaxID=1408157 RepID=A0A1J7J1H8_9PEZI|nr:YjeF N-terminal domain-like protein [Coniochaeta ligniaria NRRL 30616]